MFTQFFERFPVDPEGQDVRVMWNERRLTALVGYRELASVLAGRSVHDGLYRLHDSITGPRALALVAESFPDYSVRSCPFGYDWLGRQFAVDSERSAGGEPAVLLLEPGTHEVLEVPESFRSLHNVEFVQYADEVLLIGAFDAWAQLNAEKLPLSGEKCVGFKVPPVLGGSDELDNLEVSNVDLYWSIMGQIHHRVGGVDNGVSIDGVKIAE